MHEKVNGVSVKESLMYSGIDANTDEGVLLLAELLLKANAGYYNSHTEEIFLRQFNILRKDRTATRTGRKFLVDVFYNHSNKKPLAFNLMRDYRYD